MVNCQAFECNMLEWKTRGKYYKGEVTTGFLAVSWEFYTWVPYGWYLNSQDDRAPSELPLIYPVSSGHCWWYHQASSRSSWHLKQDKICEAFFKKYFINIYIIKTKRWLKWWTLKAIYLLLTFMFLDKAQGLIWILLLVLISKDIWIYQKDS